MVVLTASRPAGRRPGPAAHTLSFGHSRVGVGGAAMDLGLRGRRALITGGSRGIGFAVAEVLAAEGAAVGLVARDAAGLAAAAERLKPRGVAVATAAADVTDIPRLRSAVDDIATALGGLDHLVANAGGTVGRGNLTSAGDG